MKRLPIAAGLIGATLLTGSHVRADNEAGVPLQPGEAAGAWSLESNGQPLCAIDLGRRYVVRAETGCESALPATPSRWAPTEDGMRLVAADGRTVVGFHRWSNSLFVAHTPNGDLQLRRGR
jgi:hypothetical protein